MKTSTHGLAVISQFEGCVLHVYPDQSGLPSIGVGHLLRPGESYPNGITHEQAMALLAGDVSAAEVEVNRACAGVDLSQDQFDACVSLTFNIGTGGFEGSTVHRLLLVGDYAGAADAFLLWDKRAPKPGELIRDAVTGGMREPRPGELVIDAGLLARRKAERALFLGESA